MRYVRFLTRFSGLRIHQRHRSAAGELRNQLIRSLFSLSLRSDFRMPFYAVRKGKNIGIYETWSECEAQVKKFAGAQFKKFSTKVEAQAFIDVGDSGTTKTCSAPDLGRLKRSFDTPCQKPLFTSDESTAFIKRQTNNNPDTDATPFTVVYTDGACTANGRHTAAGGIGVYWGYNDARNVSEPLPPGRQTNNRAEILACARAIEQAIKTNVKRLEIRTDSNFTIKCMTQYFEIWKRKNWVRSTGEPILNLEELRVLDSHKQKFEDNGGRLKFVHVSGHSGEPGNEAADQLAVNGAKSYKRQ